MLQSGPLQTTTTVMALDRIAFRDLIWLCFCPLFQQVDQAVLAASSSRFTSSTEL